MSETKTLALGAALAEHLLTIHPEAEPGMPIDDIEMACDRAIAALYLLSGQFIEPAEQSARYSDRIIFDAITGVQGTIEVIRALARHGYQTTEPAKVSGGDA